MKPFLSLGIALAGIFIPYLAKADISVVANVQGASKVRSSGVVKHRRSLDCYAMGKGDDHQDYGSQTVTLAGGGQTIVGSGQASWYSDITSPFAKRVRTTILSSQVASDSNGDHVQLSLQDQFAGELGQIHSEKCRHTNGFVTVNDATVEGSVKVRYTVPANVWAVRLLRSNYAGVFSVINFQSISTALNAGYDKGKTTETILWVKPGQILEQDIVIPSFVGPANIGSVTLEFLPVGKTTGTDIGNFLKEMKARKFSQGLSKNTARQFLQDTMSMLRLGEGVTAYTKSISLYDLKQISDRFFEIANSVYDDETGHAVKTAAALASFQISQSILMDMRGYCQDVEVYLPFTGEKQKVLGLKAASFWLSRSMNYIKTYSYEPAEIFIQELTALQARGLTAASIAKDEKLRTKMQNAFLLLTKTMNFEAGPFNRAYVDFNKMASTFKNIQSLGPQQQDLLAVLRLANTEEQEFIRAFGAMTRQLNRTNTNQIDVAPLVAKMTALKTKQASIPQLLRESLRLLSLDPSEDQGQVINQVVDLLNHQMNIFMTPINVPYFESVRAAFYEANVKDFRSASQGCFQLDGVNP